MSLSSRREIYRSGKKIGLSTSDIDYFISRNETINSDSGSVGSNDTYKSGTWYGTVSTSDIYKAGTMYGSISPDDF